MSDSRFTNVDPFTAGMIEAFHAPARPIVRKARKPKRAKPWRGTRVTMWAAAVCFLVAAAGVVAPHLH